jgi:hypothetical protein
MMAIVPGLRDLSRGSIIIMEYINTGYNCEYYDVE